MANLSEILSRRIPSSIVSSVGINETNLTTGEIYLFSYFGTGETEYVRSGCWVATQPGTVKIEAWGAGGSSASGCCCGMGTPGNSGAYVKKTVEVVCGDWICMTFSAPCMNATTNCFRGCSGAACVRICRPNCRNFECICLCAQGGAGGFWVCNPQGTGHFCCMRACGFCGTVCANQCGIICNLAPGCNDAVGLAYGGDVNCPGLISCLNFMFCAPNGTGHHHHVPYPAGLYNTDGGYITYDVGCCYVPDQSGHSLIPFFHALSGITPKSLGMHQGSHIDCWSGNVYCLCSMWFTGCLRFLPPGVGAPGSFVTGNCRTPGWAGGNTAVKLTFVGS